MFSVLLFCSLVGSISLVAGHATLWSPAMWGFNVTAKTFSYDNRPLVPLSHDTFEKWWFHGHLSYPPPDNTFLELPAGGTLNSEIACDKGATSFFASSPGGNIQSGNNPCPKAPTTAFHANNEADTRGCGLGITYQSDVNSVKPEDFTIFTVNHTCVWNRFTDFQIPADLPACPEGGCICSFNWIHAPDSGSEQIFMNGYRCKVTNANSNKKVATPRLARRCGQNANKNANVAPWNCTYGAKQAMYWLQAEASTFFEGAHDPPFYNDLYNFPNGAQNDIFQDSQLPVFNEAGEQTGFTTLGGSSATTVNIVTPSSSSGWPTTTSAASGQQVAATGGPDSSSSSSSSSVPALSGSSSKASVATNVAKNPSSSSSSSQAPAPTTSSSTSQAHASSSSSSSSSSTSTSTSTSTADASSSSSSSSSATTKCRKRESNAIKKMKKRAFGAHKKMSKRHDIFF